MGWLAFPERPGALRKFLTGLHQRWNISLFHYRNHGGGTYRPAFLTGFSDVLLQILERCLQVFRSRYRTTRLLMPIYESLIMPT